GADRLFRRTASRPRDTAHRHGETRAAAALRPTRHRLDHLAADGTYPWEQLFGHAQLGGLLRIGIGNIAGLEPGGAAGDAGDGLGDAAAGAGLGGADLGLQAQELRTQHLGLAGDGVHGLSGKTDGSANPTPRAAMISVGSRIIRMSFATPRRYSAR